MKIKEGDRLKLKSLDDIKKEFKIIDEEDDYIEIYIPNEEFSFLILDDMYENFDKFIEVDFVDGNNISYQGRWYNELFFKETTKKINK